MNHTETICEAFDLIRRYAKRKGWIPIGWREFTVGPWRVRVNGTREVRDAIQPYHALVEHQDIIAFMALNPFQGTIGGWKDTESDFIATMQAELGKPVAEARK